jgi:predicted MFS family arabinose efflux permease
MINECIQQLPTQLNETTDIVKNLIIYGLGAVFLGIAMIILWILFIISLPSKLFSSSPLNILRKIASSSSTWSVAFTTGGFVYTAYTFYTFYQKFLLKISVIKECKPSTS